MEATPLCYLTFLLPVYECIWQEWKTKFPVLKQGCRLNPAHMLLVSRMLFLLEREPTFLPLGLVWRKSWLWRDTYLANFGILNREDLSLAIAKRDRGWVTEILKKYGCAGISNGSANYGWALVPCLSLGEFLDIYESWALGHGRLIGILRYVTLIISSRRKHL